MKLTTLILITAILQVSANTYAQKISLSEKNAPLSKVFDQIRAQSGYDFFVTTSILKEAKPVTINVKDEDITIVLKKIFEDQPFEYSIDKKSVVVSKKEPSILEKIKMALAIPVIVSGRVTDTTGAALIGATLKITGQTSNMLTNKDGNFTFSAEPGTAVTISFIGFKPYTFRVMENLPFQNITLHAFEGKLDEVVIVNNGYERISKERATGAYDYIDEKTLNKQVGSNILDRLRGTVSGLMFGIPDANGVERGYGTNTSPFNIRGLSTINADATPLVVVDNFPYSGDIKNINPNDVESITILKDAAAASIWGARAGNGVVVITTKTGKYNQKLKVGFNSNTSISDKPNLFAASGLSPADFIDIEKMMFDRGEYDDAIADTYYRTALTPAVTALNEYRNNQISLDQLNTLLNSYKQHNSKNDWNKYIYKKGINQRYSTNLSGGTSDMNYYLSGGYDRSLDQLSASYNRLNILSSTTFRINNKLSITTGLKYTQSENSSGKKAYGSKLSGNQFYPYMQIADVNGNSLPLSNYRKSYVDTAGSGKLLDWNYYALDDWKHDKATTTNKDLLADLSLKYRIFKGFTANVSYRYESESLTTKHLSDINSYATRDIINRYTEIDKNTGAIVYPVPVGGILYLQNGQLVSQNGRGQLTYETNWGKNQLNAQAGGEISQTLSSSNDATYYGYNADPLQYTSVDFVSSNYPNFINGSNQQIPGAPSLGEGASNRFISAYAAAGYIYNKKYTITASFRRDASNIFGVSTNNKWKPLWSTGLGWNIAEENYSALSFMSNLKLRVTYGHTGNVDNSISGLTVLRYRTGAPQTNLPYADFNSFGNPDLRWEQVSTLNMAIDFGVLNNRIFGSIDVYSKKDKDLYALTPIDPTGGAGSLINKNGADMVSKGVEIDITTKNLVNVFNWETHFLFTHNIDKVTKYYSQFGLTSNSSYVSVGNGINPMIGYPLYPIIAYKWAGLDPKTGDPRGIINGQISEDYQAIANNTNLKDLIIYGSGIPTISGSLTNTFSFKGVTLDVMLLYKLGYYFKKESVDYSNLLNSNAPDFSKRWQNPGDELKTYVPSMIYPDNTDRDYFYNGASILVEKGDHVRLQNVRLAYDLSGLIKNKTHLSMLQLYVNASDLGIIWRANKNHLDPDYNNIIPQSKTYTLGVAANF